MNNEKQYISLLKYEKGNLLLEEKDLAKYANMHKESVIAFPQMIEYLLSQKNLDSYQIIKTKTHKNGVVKDSFELKVTPEEYESIREIIFNFAYVCCSNVVEERETKYWAAKEWKLKHALEKSKDLWEEGEYHALIPTKFNEYSVRLSFQPIDFKHYQNSYQSFLTKSNDKPKVRKLIKEEK